MVSPFYPYFVFDGYTDKGIAKDWKVVSLENEFISVKVLPEVGGKVWGATEKSTGLDFVYLNKVLKFRAIGIRGPWTSGGIEHNFGLDLGHAPWTSSPVDYLLKENTDGSVSCIVGGMDLASRTQWRVNIRLPADKACFETYSIWYNPNPLHDAYLSWENAGFKATDDLQFFFPGNHYIGHDGSLFTGKIILGPASHTMYQDFIQTGSVVTGMILTLDLATGHPILMLPGKRYGYGRLPAMVQSGKIFSQTMTDSILRPSQV